MKTNYFIDETPEVLEGWDGKITMDSVPGRLDYMELGFPLPCGNDYIPIGFQWNGASVGPLRSLPFIGFPKWKHPIATCRHDWRCGLARNRKERKIADMLFKRDIRLGQEDKKMITWWEQFKGYFGVRIGALFTIGV